MPYYRGKKISALILDWENNIASGKNPSKTRPLLLAYTVKYLMGLQAGSAATRKFCNLYPHLCLETVFPALKLTQNCYLHYNMTIFFLKTGSLIIDCLLPMPHVVLKNFSHHLTKYEGKGTSKISIFKLLVN